MTIHIALHDALVAELDRRFGRRRRSAFIGEVLRRSLEDERPWDDIETTLGQIADFGHDWTRILRNGSAGSAAAMRVAAGDDGPFAA